MNVTLTNATWGQDWHEWTTRISTLVGLEDVGSSTTLLVPCRDQPDLTDRQAQELARTIHDVLFCRYCNPNAKLERLRLEPARQSLPLLYYSAWMLRHQTRTNAFWSGFHRKVVRDRLALGTVRQQIAPSISALWNKAHIELGLYRPAESALVHVKWPRAHAGILPSDLRRLGYLVSGGARDDEGLPQILSEEPDVFLAEIRIAASGGDLSSRLREILYGPDGPALIVAELAQSGLKVSWPPEGMETSNTYGQYIAAPRLRLDCDGPYLLLELPPGRVEGEHVVVARHSTEVGSLESVFHESTQLTHYSGRTWRLDDSALDTRVGLTFAGRSVDVALPLGNPFGLGNMNGALLFNANSGYLVKKWQPGQEYLLILRKMIPPDWASCLFDEIEYNRVFWLGDTRLHLFEVRGTSLEGLDESRIAEFLSSAEQKVEQSRVAISLPSVRDLRTPSIVLRGGMVAGMGQTPVYYAGTGPDICPGLSTGTVQVSKLRDDGEATVEAREHATGDQSSVAFLAEGLLPGIYRAELAGQRQDFRVVEFAPRLSDDRFEIALVPPGACNGLECPMRLLCEEGIRVRTWRHCRFSLSCRGSTGSTTRFFNADSSGTRLVHVSELSIDEEASWTDVQARAWLATSNVLHFVSKPYVEAGEFAMGEGFVRARIRGLPERSNVYVVLMPIYPWRTPVTRVLCTTDDHGWVEASIPPVQDVTSVAIVDGHLTSTWFALSICKPPRYSTSDLRDVLEAGMDTREAARLARIVGAGHGELQALLEIAAVAKDSGIPTSHETVKPRLGEWVLEHGSSDQIPVCLPPDWLAAGTLNALLVRGPHGASLCIEENQFPVLVESTEEGFRLTWRDQSGPCVCVGCGKIMHQVEGWGHIHGATCRGFRALDRTLLVGPRVTWEIALSAIKQTLLETVAQGARHGPEGFRDVWDTLQTAHRQISQPRPNPQEFVLGVFDAALTISRLLAGQEPADSWDCLNQSISPWRSGVVSLASLWKDGAWN